MQNNNKIALLTCALLLAACDSKDSTPLPGTRESFLNITASIQTDPKAKNAIVKIPTQVVNDSWPTFVQNCALAKDVKLFWSKSIGSGVSTEQRILTNPVTKNGVLYAIDAKGMVSAMQLPKDKADNAEPTLLWGVQTSPDGLDGDAIGGGVTADADHVYVATSFGEMMALDVKTGAIKWKQSGFAAFRGSPTVMDGRVMAQAINNELVVLAKKTGETQWTHSGLPEPTQLLSASTPSMAHDTIIVAYSSGEVHALNSLTGQVLWSDTITPVVRIDTVTGIPHITARPVIDGDMVYLISHGGRMSALDIKTGARVWQKELGGTHTPLVVGDYIFTLTNQSELVCMDKKTGAVASVIPLQIKIKDETSAFLSGPILAGGKLYVSSSAGNLIVVDPVTQKILPAISVDGAPQLAPLVSNNTLYVLTDDAVIHAYR